MTGAGVAGAGVAGWALVTGASGDIGSGIADEALACALSRGRHVEPP